MLPLYFLSRFEIRGAGQKNLLSLRRLPLQYVQGSFFLIRKSKVLEAGDMR